MGHTSDREDTTGKTRGGGRGGSGSGTVSLDDDDAIDVGLFSSGPATIKESIFTDYDYGGNTKGVAVWLLTYSRDGESDYEQPYSLGKGWKVGKDGLSISSKNGQASLAKSCNAIRHLVTPLKKALREAKIDVPNELASGNPSFLEGMEVVVQRVPQEQREGLDKRGGRDRDRDRGRDDKPKERTILEIEEVVSAPWEAGSGGGKKKTATTAKGKGRTAKDADDDEDDDEDEKKQPAKGRAGKGRDANDEAEDDNDSDNDNDAIAEAGVEALLEALANGPIEYDDLEKAIKKEVKGNKQADDIVEWCLDVKNLKKQLGWSWDSKGQVVDLEPEPAATKTRRR